MITKSQIIFVIFIVFELKMNVNPGIAVCLMIINIIEIVICAFLFEACTNARINNQDK
jgi:hypothetical protein